MAAFQRFLAIMIADLRERTRTARFWAMLAVMIIAIWWCFPKPTDGYMILSLQGGERGLYSSAWVGMVLAMAFSLLLSLGGFYLVRGTLARDFDTRVWQLLVTTPMTRAGYLVAKWASHMLILVLIVLIGLIIGVIAQWLRGEDRHYDLIELVKPLLLLTLPGLAITSMFAIWFDLLPWLRRTAGNVVFFFLWCFLTAVSVSQFEGADRSTLQENWRSDPNGMAMAAREFSRVREVQTGKPHSFGFSVGAPRPAKGPVTFEWPSWRVRPMDAFGRLLWLVAALFGVVLAAPLLDWAAARGSTARQAGKATSRRLRWLDRLLGPLARGSFGILAVAELKIVLRERRLWWWLLVLAAFAAQSFGDGEALQNGLLLAWILPLDILARSILRERDHGSGGLVFTAPKIVGRLLATRLAAGVLLLTLLTLPGLLHLMSLSAASMLAALVISISIVSWGLSLGALCRNPRPFELLLLATSYVAVQGAPWFDVIGQPLVTASWHAGLLLPAWLILAWAWPRLARV